VSQTILITGVSGFIGGYLAQYFLRLGKKVVGLSRHNNYIQHTNYRWIKGDLTSSISKIVNIDICVHAAAQSPESMASTYSFVKNNTIATENLLQSLQKTKCRKIIFLSGVSVYGEVNISEISEQTPVVNPCPYGLSKLLAERILQEQNSIPICILRLPGVLGKGARTPWLARQIQKAIRNETITIYNPGSFFNNAIWIDDLLVFIDRLINMDNHNLFLLGAENKILIQDIVEFILNKTKSKSKIEQVEGESSFTLNISRAKKSGYKSKTMKTILINQMDCTLAERRGYASN